MSFVQFKIFYGDNFERCKMHRMKKERFELITYQEFASDVLKPYAHFWNEKLQEMSAFNTETTKTRLLT